MIQALLSICPHAILFLLLTYTPTNQSMIAQSIIFGGILLILGHIQGVLLATKQGIPLPKSLAFTRLHLHIGLGQILTVGMICAGLYGALSGFFSESIATVIAVFIVGSGIYLVYIRPYNIYQGTPLRGLVITKIILLIAVVWLANTVFSAQIADAIEGSQVYAHFNGFSHFTLGLIWRLFTLASLIALAWGIAVIHSK